MNHLQDLTGNGNFFANPMTVLAVTRGRSIDYSNIVIAGEGAIYIQEITANTLALAERIDGLIDAELEEEFEESDYEDMENEDGDE